jgi:hypothetical protein
MLLISVLDNFLTLTNYYNTSDFSATQETWFKTTMEVCLKGLGLSPQPKTEKIVVRSQMMAGSRIIDNTIMSGPDFLCAKALSERMCVCVCGWLAVPCEGEINA